MACDIMSTPAGAETSLGAGSESKMTWAHGLIHICEDRRTDISIESNVMCVCVSEWVSEWVRERVSEWVSEWVSEREREWERERVRESERDLEVWEDGQNLHRRDSGFAVMLGNLEQKNKSETHQMPRVRVSVCVCVCVREWINESVCALVRECVCVCVCACVSERMCVR